MSPAVFDIPSLVRAVSWPAIIIVALVQFRKPLTDLIKALGRNAKSITFAGFSLEFARISEMSAGSIDTELRELEAGLNPTSSSPVLLFQVREQIRDYIVIDLGSEKAPRWLSSRLYLFGLLLSRVGRLNCFVFVETAGGLRKRFVGIASPDSIRWAFARRYPWYEYAYAQVYSQLGALQLEGAAGSLSEVQANILAQRFLAAIRVPGGSLFPFPDPDRLPKTIDLGNGIMEYAVWVDGGRMERIPGRDLSASFVTVPSEKSLNEMSAAVLRQHGRFVAVVDPDRTFRGLVDRSAAMENVAVEFLRHAYSEKS